MAWFWFLRLTPASLHSVGARALNPPLSRNANGATCRWVLVHAIPANIPPTRPHSSARCEASGSCHQTPAANTRPDPNSAAQRAGCSRHPPPPHNGLPPPARRLHQGKMARFTGARLLRLGVPLLRPPQLATAWHATSVALLCRAKASVGPGALTALDRLSSGGVGQGAAQQGAGSETICYATPRAPEGVTPRGRCAQALRPRRERRFGQRIITHRQYNVISTPDSINCFHLVVGPFNLPENI